MEGATSGSPLPKGRIGDIIRQLAIAEGSKVRSFRWSFTWDLRLQPQLQRRVDLLFLYISAPGQGLQVQILEDHNPL
jgi:anaerobic magnesium-protoporphyrin IX monomethyl ester cyclase